MSELFLFNKMHLNKNQVEAIYSHDELVFPYIKEIKLRSPLTKKGKTFFFWIQWYKRPCIVVRMKSGKKYKMPFYDAHYPAGVYRDEVINKITNCFF